jgi:mannonate dehydratase
MDLSLRMPVEPTQRWRHATQLGVTHAVTNLPRTAGDVPPWGYEPLLEMRNRFADHGFEVDVIESRPPMEDVVLGREGRDEEIEAVETLLRNMGRLDIPVYCWVWTENPLGVLRTSRSVPDRGDTRQSGYDHEQFERGPRHPAAGITEEELWENLEYFLDRVVPVAEEAGVKLALHPDDPPISPVRGVPRLVTDVDAYDRILDLHPSDHHGVCLCQGNFGLMDTPVPEAIRHFGDDVHFVHFRDVEGTPDSFVERWHDDGQTDMAAAIEAYDEVGFEGPIRPDHVGTMDGDEGRGNLGRLYAIGYMRGLIERA